MIHINHHPVVLLASASPRRSELLAQIQVKHQIIHVPSGPGEDEPRHDGELPLDYVLRTAKDKAQRAILWLDTVDAKKQILKGAQETEIDDSPPIILTADTTVCLGEKILGKPEDHHDAREILKTLSGKIHLVHTAVVVTKGQHQWSAISSTEVTFDLISDSAIEAYIQTGEPFGKAGAYGIQGLAATFIKQINGSYSGVMGLPLYETDQLLKQALA